MVLITSQSMPAHYQAAITLYTAHFYNGESLSAVLNKLLRDADRSKIKCIAKYVWLLMHAMDPRWGGRAMACYSSQTYLVIRLFLLRLASRLNLFSTAEKNCAVYR